MKSLLIIFQIVFLLVLGACSPKPVDHSQLLVFHKTEQFRHKSIDAGLAALEKLANENGFGITVTQDASVFTQKNLQNYDALLFLNTTGNVLNDDQQQAMEYYIRNGGGFVGVHAAADTEWRGDWVWYRGLVGAVFESHPKKPNVQAGALTIVDGNHGSTKMLDTPHIRKDEWYNFKDYYGRQTVLITIDEASYRGGTNGDFHPISWYQTYDGGRSFYTAMGHTKDSYTDLYFLNHLRGGIEYAFGGK